jgi:hypothetical protein
VRVKAESLESVRERLRAAGSDEVIAALKRRVEQEARPRELPARFREKTEPDANGCLLWTAATTHNGYGVFQVGGRALRAHRHAWESEHGPIPDGHVVHQACGNRLCVNVEHLELMDLHEHATQHRRSKLRANCGPVEGQSLPREGRS